MARIDWQYVNGSTNNNSVFFTGIRWRYRDDLFGTTGYPSDRLTSNTDIIEYQPFSGRKQSYNTFSYTSWKTSYYRYSYNTVSGEDPGTAGNNLNVSTTFRFDKATNNTKYYPVKGALSASNVFNISSDDTSRIIQVQHCSDGTSKVRLFFHYTGDSNTAFSYGETNVVITLETIARKSSIDSVDTVEIGENTVISINRLSDSYTSTIQYRLKIGSDLSWKTIVTKTSSTKYTWTVPSSLYSEITTATILPLWFRVETFNGNDSIGVSDIYEGYVMATTPPTVSGSSTDINSTTAQLTMGQGTTTSTTKMIKYKSNVQVSFTTTGQNYATISSATINGVNIELSSNDNFVTATGSYTFNGATTNSFTIRVVDSRGNSKETTLNNLQMVNYVPLTINATVVRNQPTNNKVNLTFSGNYYNGSFGSQSNTLTVQYRYREKNGNYGNWITISHTKTNNTYSGGTGDTPIENIDYTKEYEFQVQATDKLGSVPTTKAVTKGEPVFWWDNDEFNVNGTFGVGGRANLHGLTNRGGVELYETTPYIDFHYNNSTSDYTSRIIEESSGQLKFTGNLNAKTIQNMYGASGTGSSTSTYVRLCNISFNAHTQGEFVGMKIYIGRGNNGTADQQAFIDLSMQLGWTGSNDGRLGCTWELHPMKTTFDFNNVNVIVIANSRTSYDIYLWTSVSYCKPYYIVNCSKAVTVTNYGTASTTAPSGTQCYIDKVLSSFDTTTGTGVVTRSSGATLNSSTYARDGNVVTLSISLTSSGSTNAGSNAFTGTINNATYKPKVGAGGSSFNGSVGILGYIDTSGNITVRVLSAQLTSGKTFDIVFTYVI